MTTFTVYIGLPASGKTHFAKELEKKTGAVYISPDEIREQWSGDAGIQGDNTKLFGYVHGKIVYFLKEGKDVILDATNMSHKFRRILLEKVSKTGATKKAIFVATPYDECLENNKSRDRVVPEYVIENMRKAFVPPSKSEGWDDIEIIWNIRGESKDWSLGRLFLEMDNFEQDNEHHEHTLGDHLRYAYRTLDSDALASVRLATQLHDIGKLETKVFHTMKGVKTENAHYYGHNGCGAYNVFHYLKNDGHDDELILEVSLLISLHMRVYFSKTPKAIGRLIRWFGQKTYDNLLKINRADRMAH